MASFPRREQHAALAFLSNNTVNWLNLHYGFHALALGIAGVFFASFLLAAGLPAPTVLAVLAAIFGGRFFIRPLILPLARRFGLKALVIAGTLLTAAQYPLLAQVHGLGMPLIALCVVAATGDTLYWTTYHAYFAALGDPEHRGHQVGAREAAAAVMGVIGPLIGGWALVTVGPQAAFGAAGLVLAASAIPLFRTPEVTIVRQAPGALRAALPGVLIFVADGWVQAGFYFLWQIALFVTLGRNFAAFGGAMALSALVGAVSGLVLGRLIDRGHGLRVVWLAVGALAGVIAFRAAGYASPLLAVIASAAGAVVTAIYTPTVMTAVYNQARLSPCILRFQIAAEGGFDAGCATGCLATALMLWCGAPLFAALLLPLIGAAAMFALLRRHYAAA